MWRAQVRRGLPSPRIILRQTFARDIHEFSGPIELSEFREVAFQPAQPIVLRKEQDHSPVPLPALTKWFARDKNSATDLNDRVRELLSYQCIFNYEVMYPTAETPPPPLVNFLMWLDEPYRTEAVPRLWGAQASKAFWDHNVVESLLPHIAAAHKENTGSSLFQFSTRPWLLLRAMDYNKEHPEAPVGEVYVAQTPLDSLPQELQDDVQPPELVLKAGKADIYASSLWLGLQPTYTPWHRDPNPNLFVQLEGSKSVALLPPNRGETLFREVQAKIGVSGSSRVRGEEMMQGAQRSAFLEAIWGDGHADGIEYVQVTTGDAAFIPKGWWHSVRSEPDVGKLNASVNWWFR